MEFLCLGLWNRTGVWIDIMSRSSGFILGLEGLDFAHHRDHHDFAIQLVPKPFKSFSASLKF